MSTEAEEENCANECAELVGKLAPHRRVRTILMLMKAFNMETMLKSNAAGLDEWTCRQGHRFYSVASGSCPYCAIDNIKQAIQKLNLGL